MPYKPPNKILVTSEDSIMEYQRTVPKNKNNPVELFVYKFIESKTKNGVEFEMTEHQIIRQLTNLFKII